MIKEMNIVEINKNQSIDNFMKYIIYTLSNVNAIYL